MLLTGKVHLLSIFFLVFSSESNARWLKQTANPKIVFFYVKRTLDLLQSVLLYHTCYGI